MAANPPTMIEDRAMPNAALRLLFVAIEDVMGPDGMKAVLNGAKMQHYIGHYPPNDLEYGVTFGQYGKLEQAIEDFYGPRGARAMLLRVGRATFQAGLKEQSAVLGLAGQALKGMPLLSMQAKMKLLLQQIIGAANKTINQPAAIMYFAFFAVGVLSGTILTAGGGKKGGASKGDKNGR